MISVNLLLILITAVISYAALQSDNLFSSLTLNPYAITKKNQWYRFVTSGFVHADYGHLLFNMLSLYFFGDMVAAHLEAFYPIGVPGLSYILFYIVAVIVSDIPTFIQERNNYNYQSLGASGAVSAVIFAAVALAPEQKICLYFFLCLPGVIFGILFLLYSAYQSRSGRGQGINHSAHLYGAIFGLFIFFIFIPGIAANFLDKLVNIKLF